MAVGPQPQGPRRPRPRGHPLPPPGEEASTVAVLDGVASQAGEIRVRPRAAVRRERWMRRLPLLPALIYTIIVTQVPFVVTLWYSFQSYFWDIPQPAHFTGLSNYKTVFTDPA